MNIAKLSLSILLSSSILIAATPIKKEKELASVIKMGDRGSKMLLTTLGKNMKKRMKKGGVMKALNFCSNQAYNLTEKVNKKLPVGVRVKRISTKYRSPANKPTSNEQAILDTFKSMKELNIVLPPYLIEKVDSRTYKYYKPLVLNKKVCLKCHGKIKDIELKREIASKYPLDHATGYKMGDLRGAVIVTIDKSAK